MANQKNNTSKRVNTQVTTTTIPSNVKVVDIEPENITDNSVKVDTHIDNTSDANETPVESIQSPNIDNAKSETDLNSDKSQDQVTEPAVQEFVEDDKDAVVVPVVTEPNIKVDGNVDEVESVVSSIETEDNQIKVGVKVKLKEDVAMTVTGQKIPAFAYKNEYRVAKVLPFRVVISAGTLTFAVKATDIVVL